MFFWTRTRPSRGAKTKFETPKHHLFAPIKITHILFKHYKKLNAQRAIIDKLFNFIGVKILTNFSIL